MTDGSAAVIAGTLDLLILKTLSLESMHGWGIGQQIGGFQLKLGSVYAALEITTGFQARTRAMTDPAGSPKRKLTTGGATIGRTLGAHPFDNRMPVVLDDDFAGGS